MEAELLSAVAEYRAQLASLEQLLAEDPDNAEVKEVYEQLQGALSYTLAALDEQQQQAGGAEVTDVAASSAAGPDGTAGDGDRAVADGGGSAAAAQEGGVDVTCTATAATGAMSRPRGGAPNNARMHPSNLYYRQEPDFAALAREYAELRPHVATDAAGRAHLDTTSWAATRALTACLLRHDFGLRWWLPEGQLVPPVPNRANYIHWLNDLLDLSAPEDGGPVRGLDIGCGANFIYCLLGAVLYGWNMVGVDVTQVAVRCSQQLIADNPQVAALLEVRDLSYLHPELQEPDAAAPAGATGLDRRGRRGRKRPAEGRDADPGGAAAEARGHEGARGEGGSAEAPGGIPTAGVDDRAANGGCGGAAAEAAGDERAGDAGPAGEEQGILLPAFVDGTETFAFTMCNPPFFESMQEAAQNPNTAFGGTAAEMVCPGGELTFVLRMLLESEALRERVHWFSTMVGKKSTLKALRKELHSRHVTALRTTELAQGKTSRWAVAWSWQVDPNKASQPLRRLDAVPGAQAAAAEGAGEDAAAGAGAASGGRARGPAPHAASDRPKPAPAPSLAAAGMPLLPRRHISFTVQLAGALTSRTVLREVERLLREAGCGSLELDASAWTVAWPLQVGPFSAAGADDTGARGPNMGPRDSAPQGSGSWASNIQARLRIAQQQRGRLELVATIPNTSPDAAARAFAGLMAGLEQGLMAATTCAAR